jgi:hypothetical protein
MHIGIIAFSVVANDPRVVRQVRALSPEHRVTTIGYGTEAPAGSTLAALEVPPRRNLAGRILYAGRLLTRRFSAAYHSVPAIAAAKNVLARHRFDVIIANDIDTLPLTLEEARGATVVFDAHEYSPLEWEDLWTWRLLFQRFKRYLCQTYIPRCDAVMTVCRSIAERYHADTGVTCAVVTNAPAYATLEPVRVDIDRIALIHHGAAIRSRRLESTIAMMRHLDRRFHLTLMLVANDQDYLNHLRRVAADLRNVSFRDPVPLGDIARTINTYDIGVFLLEPVSFNYRFALPNKFFDFIQARLGIAIGPSPEMADIVRRHSLGVVADDFRPETLAHALNGLDRDRIAGFKTAAHRIAQEYAAERNQEIIRGLVEDAHRRRRQPMQARVAD